jgi:hypothetical protein
VSKSLSVGAQTHVGRAPIPVVEPVVKEVVEPLAPELVEAITRLHARTHVVSLKVACERLGGIATSSIYELIKSGQLSSVMIGQARRGITLASLDDYLAGQ